MKLYLVVHGGYDFDPTTLAICETRKRADEMLAEHYKRPENADFPWNGCWVEEAETDRFIAWAGVRSGENDGETQPQEGA